MNNFIDSYFAWSSQVTFADVGFLLFTGLLFLAFMFGMTMFVRRVISSITQVVKMNSYTLFDVLFFLFTVGCLISIIPFAVYSLNYMNKQMVRNWRNIDKDSQHVSRTFYIYCCYGSSGVFIFSVPFLLYSSVFLGGQKMTLTHDDFVMIFQLVVAGVVVGYLVIDLVIVIFGFLGFCLKHLLKSILSRREKSF